MSGARDGTRGDSTKSPVGDPPFWPSGPNASKLLQRRQRKRQQSDVDVTTAAIGPSHANTSSTSLKDIPMDTLDDSLASFTYPPKTDRTPPDQIAPDPGAMSRWRSAPGNNHFSPSPPTSPPVTSPLRSPPRKGHSPAPGASMPAHFLTAAGSHLASDSPWRMLADTSGAPTPSIHGPGRSSPHLGGPFEKLDIGSSWSGANLDGGPTGRRNSMGQQDSNQTTPSKARSPDESADLFANFRAMAGQASASGLGSARLRDISGQPRADDTGGVLTPLPESLARRRASLPKNSPGSQVPIATIHQVKAPSPLGSSTSGSSQTARTIQPLLTASLPALLPLSTTLVLDLRPPSAFHSSHLPTAHSLPIPSTLLRRSAFDLKRLVQMLPGASSAEVGKWKEKRDIIMLDADSGSLSGTIDGLACKFERAGYAGSLWYVKGGHEALRKTEVEIIADEEEEGAATAASPGTGSLMIGKLGSLAFQQGSTGSNLQLRRSVGGLPSTPETPLRRDPFSPPTSDTERPGFSPRPLSVRSLNIPSPRHSNFQPANPFFDNIRQNLELSRGITAERVPLDLPPDIVERASELPEWMADLAILPAPQSAERLAEEFYQVELKEQRRLQAVMDWHTRDSGAAWIDQIPGRNKASVDGLLEEAKSVNGSIMEDGSFPFSITAGVERGAKNRYKNIWPYEFSRVKLDSPPEKDSDYINASYVQPRGTRRKYIATQGPLDATYCDFWTLVWEQGVEVIVMLTKQFEGGNLKCGNYWDALRYGKLRVHPIAHTGGEDHVETQTTGFDFGPAAALPDQSGSDMGSQDVNIHRTFLLSREDADVPPRKVVQIQCTAWPDLDVPDSPDVLLNLIKDVDTAMSEAAVSDGQDGRRDLQPPILVHCSAGVGRTGAFIIVDAILDSLQKDRRVAYSRDASSPPATVPDQLQIDHDMDEPRDVTRETSARTGSFPSALVSGDIKSRSGDSASLKSVSFASPPISGSPTDTSPPWGEGLRPGETARLTESPSPFEPPEASSHDSHVNDLGTKTVASVRRHLKADQMEVDPLDAGDKVLFAHHRGLGVGSSDSEDVVKPTRSGLVSAHSRAQKLGANALHGDFGTPPYLARSTERRSLSQPFDPAQDGTSPVAYVLEGMRIQRMSLVQSLRQYMFVHKAIIYGYLHMIDEDQLGEHSTSFTSDLMPHPSSMAPVSSHFPNNSLSTLATSASDDVSSVAPTTLVSWGSDEDVHSKRRASPTELFPGADKLIKDPEISLSKRPSFKKMRPGSGPVSGTAPSLGDMGRERGGTPTSTKSADVQVSQVSPKKKARSERAQTRG